MVKATLKLNTRLLKSLTKVTPEILEATGLQAVGIVKRNTPVDTGNLRSSIDYSTKNRQGSIRKPDKDNEVEVGTNVEYAGFVEFGTRYQAPQPFLRESRNPISRAFNFIARSILQRLLK